MYTEHGFSLTANQKHIITQAMANHNSCVIRLTHPQLTGDDRLLVPQRTKNRTEKCDRKGVGMRLKISKNMIKQNQRNGYLSYFVNAPLIRPQLSAIGATLLADTFAGSGISKSHLSIGKRLATTPGVARLIEDATMDDAKALKREFVGMGLVDRNITNSAWNDTLTSLFTCVQTVDLESAPVDTARLLICSEPPSEKITFH